MQLLQCAYINGAEHTVGKCSNYNFDPHVAVSKITKSKSTSSLTAALLNAIAGPIAHSPPWVREFTGFIPEHQQPPRQGRRTGIDLYNSAWKIAIEIELSNQTCFAHDLLKIELAYLKKLADCGVVITLCRGSPSHLGFSRPSSASLSFETAERWLKIHQPVITAPILLLGLG